MNNDLEFDLPRSGTIFVEKIKVCVSNQFTSVDSRLYCSQTSQNPDLLHVADHGADLQPLALGVHRVEAAYQVLEKQFKCLWQT